MLENPNTTIEPNEDDDSNEDKNEMYNHIWQEIERDPSLLKDRGWAMSQKFNSNISLAKHGASILALIDDNDRTFRSSISAEGNETEDGDSFVEKYGLKYEVALEAMSYYFKLFRESEGAEPTSSPAIILGQFERVGSTWIMDYMDKVGRGHTEPLRQHIDLSSPIFSARSLEEAVSPKTFKDSSGSNGFFHYG